MVMLDSERDGADVGAGAVAARPWDRGDAGCQRGTRPEGAAVAVWSVVVLVGPYELVMQIIRSAQAQPDATVMLSGRLTLP
jgi:hypothetical protein